MCLSGRCKPHFLPSQDADLVFTAVSSHVVGMVIIAVQLQLFQISKTWTVKLLLAVRHDVKRKKCTNTKGKSFIIRCCYTRKFKRRGLASYCGSGFENDERLNPLDGETRLRLTGRAMCACGLGLQSSDPVGSYLTGSPDVGYHGNRLRSRMRSVLRASALSEEADGQCDSSLLSG